MRILLLSYCFPPVPLIEAQITAKISAHLDAEVDVICAEPALWRLPAEHSLDGYVTRRFGEIVRVSHPVGHLLIAAQGRVPSLANRPDPLRVLNRRALAALRRRGVKGYDLVVTRSQFHSVHLVPLHLDERPPWVAHFSDPWVGNPARRDGPVARRVNQRLERRVLTAADRLVFTSEPAARFTLERYPETMLTKTRWVPHSFDDVLHAGSPQSSVAGDTRAGRPLLIRHVGHLRRNRHPEPIFRALRQLEADSPGTLAGIRVEFIGLTAPGMLDGAAARGLPSGLVAVCPPVSYRDSLQAMAQAELLLVTESAGTHGIDLHAKIVDYVGAGVPIVGFVPPHSPTGALIRDLGGWTAAPDQAETGAAAFAAGVAAARQRRAAPTAGPWGAPAVRERFRAGVVGAQLTEIYAEAVAAGPS